MKYRRIFLVIIVILALLVAITALASCQKEDQLEEAEIQPTVESEPSPAAPEPVPAEPTREPTEEVQADVEPDPTEVAATTTTDMDDFVSVTEFFHLKVPSGWSTEETAPGSALIIGNSEAALERYHGNSAVEPGDLILNVGFLPYMLLQQRELNSLDIQFDATPDVFMQSLLPMFRFAEDAIFNDVELISLTDDRDAGLMIVSNGEREGRILMFVAGDGVIALVSSVGYPDEMSEYEEIIPAIASEVVFSGAQEALYGTLLGG